MTHRYYNPKTLGPPAEGGFKIQKVSPPASVPRHAIWHI
jgi:hypothetical protein